MQNNGGQRPFLAAYILGTFHSPRAFHVRSHPSPDIGPPAGELCITDGYEQKRLYSRHATPDDFDLTLQSAHTHPGRESVDELP